MPEITDQIEGAKTGYDDKLTGESGVQSKDQESREFPNDVDIEVIEQPLPIRLRPSTDKERNPLHDRILNDVRARFQLSNRAMSQKRNLWRENEKQWWAYVPVDEEWRDDNHKERTGYSNDSVFPGTQPLIIPLSLALGQQIQTYILQVLFTPRPFMQIKGGSFAQHRTRGAQLFEQVLNYQSTSPYIRDLLLMYYWSQDLLIYNCAILKNIWRKDYFYQEQNEKPNLIQRMFGMQSPEKHYIHVPIYEGNQTILIDPMTFYPDPRVPLYRLNDGEFVGNLYWRSYMDLKQWEKQQYYFNIDYISNYPIGSIIEENIDAEQSTRNRIHRTSNVGPRSEVVETTQDPLIRNMAETAEIEMKVIPREYQFSPVNYPEIWKITVANDQIIIGAEKSDNPLGQFNYIPCEYFSDGHSFLCKGLMETLAWAQRHMSWFHNSRVENVKSVMNGEFLLDPAVVDLVEFKKTGPGKYFRVKQSYQGMDLTSRGVKQIDKRDTTMNHVRDAQVIFEFANLIAGTLGVAKKPAERKTATQYRTEQTMDYAKLKLFTEIIDIYGMEPWVSQCIANTQKNLEEKQFYDIVGKLDKSLDPKKLGIVEVGPDDIQGKFYYRKREGNLPLDRQGEMALDIEIMKLMIQNPTMLKTFDITAFFKDFCMARGKHNIEEYFHPPQVQSDEEVLRRAEAGDLRALVNPRTGAPTNPPNPIEGGIEAAGNNTEV